ncbi:MAG: glycosyltransferase family 2 protein, partial [Planctomycetota bacterium]
MPEQPVPFVSVIMPVRNEAGFIKRAIKRVLDNDYPSKRMEVLVVDGASDDGTRQ